MRRRHARRRSLLLCAGRSQLCRDSAVGRKRRIQMIPRVLIVIALGLAALGLAALAPATSFAEGADSTVVAAPDSSAVVPVTTKTAPASQKSTTTYLVPSLEDAGYRFDLDREHFAHRIGFSPAYGALGENELFAFRISYSPNTWLGY